MRYILGIANSLFWLEPRIYVREQWAGMGRQVRVIFVDLKTRVKNLERITEGCPYVPSYTFERRM